MEFSQETKRLFRSCYKCFLCPNPPSDLHHITKRSSASPFNASALCRECHDNITFDEEMLVTLMGQTIKYLFTQNYKATPRDEEFIRENIKLIDKAKLCLRN